MSTRYYICPVEGDGRSPETAYRAALPAGLSTSMAVDHTKGWSLVCVEARIATHTDLRRDVGRCALPDLELTASLDSLSTTEKTALQAKLLTFGITTPVAGMFGAFLRALGRQLDPNYNESVTRAG